MANRYSVATGLASANSTWDGGASVPGTGDRVLICAGHTVTVDGAREWGDDSNSSITVNGVSTDHSVTVEGTLAYSIAANTQLTLNGRMEVRAGATYRQGTRASPVPVTYTSKLLLNKSASLTDGQYGVNIRAGAYVDIYGFTKNRIATLTATANAAATTIYVDDATGWQIGDSVYLANTKEQDTDHSEVRVIAGTYTPGSLTVPLTAALSYQHLNKCPCANLTSSVTIKPYDPDYRGYFRIYTDTTSVVDASDIGYCTFDDLGYAGDGHYGLKLLPANAIYGSGYYPAQHKVLQSICCIARVAYSNAFTLFGITKLVNPIPVLDSAFISVASSQRRAILDSSYSAYADCMAAGWELFNPDNDTSWTGSWTRGWLASDGEGATSITATFARNARFMGAMFLGPSNAHAVASSVVGPGPANWLFQDCDVGGTFPRDPTKSPVRVNVSASDVTVTFQGSDTGSHRLLTVNGQLAMSATSWVKSFNKNGDITLQEEYYRDGTVLRDNSEVYRSTSSLSMTPSTAGRVFTRSFNISVAAGEVLRLIGYCKYDSAYYNSGTGFVAPTLTLSGTINGVTLTPVVYTAASANAGNWDLIDASITNSSGAPGEITVTLSTQCTPTNGLVYWDGIVVAPFVVTARHYGFEFDESSPKRTVNSSISASFATADAYTGITITWGSTSTTALTASKTFQVLYDYSQAKGVQNLTSAMPFSGAGAVNNVSLTAAGNVTTTGYTLNGGGSISMGSYTLTASIPWTYTYTGGTFAQATTVPSFTGGTLNLGAAATYTFTGSSLIVSMTPTGASTYNMGGASFSGTIDLRNTTAHAITVQVPSGTSTTTANNTGGTITVSAPSVTQGLDFTGLIAGSQVVVCTTTTQTELFRDNTSSTTETWSQAGGSNTTVDYTIMKAGYLPIRVVGVTVNSAVVSTPIAQVVDRAYAASSGLTFGSTATVNAGTSRFTLTTATTGQNWYSFMIESWIAQSALVNKQFPISTNGPNSFTLDAWEFSAGLSYIYRDGIRYIASGVATAIYAALYSVDTATGLQVKYQQTDGGTTTSASNTGKIDQLIQVYGDASHGNFDRRSWLVLKIQKDGYDQAEADVTATYSTLEDQLYIVGLNPLSNGLTTGAPTVNGSPAITDHAGSPVTWHSKAFSITITDSAAGNTGETLMRWIRYNLGAGGTFQGKDGFCWHDLVQTNGDGFKTVRGAVYGDTGAALKGVRVITNAGDDHPDFNLHTADDGTTYVPVFPAAATATVLADTRVQLYNVTEDTELDNSFVTGTAYSFTVTSGVTVGDTVRLRACKKGRMAAEATAIWTANGVTFLIDQPEDTIYTAWGIDGATVSEYSLDGTNLQIDANDVDGSTQKVRLAAYYSYALTLEAGIRLFYGALTFLAAGSIRVNVDVVDAQIDNTNATTALVFTDVNVRLFRSDGSTIIAPTSNTIHSDYNGEPYTVETGVSGLTGPESAQLLSIPSAAATAAATRTELAPELARITKVAKIHGVGVDLVVTPTSRTAGDLAQTVTTVGDTTTLSAV